MESPTAGGSGSGRPSVAVIGAGVAGIVAAYLLQRTHRVTLFEQNDYLGGHTNTILIPDGPDQGTPVDTGFIVLNRETYPLFLRFLAQLQVEIRQSDMSFGFHDEASGFQYAGTTLNGLFAQRRNLVRPSFWWMLADIVRFNRIALADLDGGRLPPSLTLGEYLAEQKLSPGFVDHYLLAMGAAIWSMPAGQMLGYPAASFVRFFKNHGLLQVAQRPTWYTVVGGSHSYVKRFAQTFSGEIRLQSRIAGVRRQADAAVVRMADGRAERFDRLVLAAHADQSLSLLEDPSDEERRLLGVWRYSKNRTTLHTWEGILPPRRRAWASWNYRREAGAGPDDPVTLTYHMNRLQGLITSRQYCVTLNNRRPIPPGSIIREMLYTHPVYSREAVESQPLLPGLNGVRRTYFCGSYFGYGFHEDAVRSAVQVGEALGVTL